MRRHPAVRSPTRTGRSGMAIILVATATSTTSSWK